MVKRYKWLLIAVVLLCTCACTQRSRTPSVVPEFGRAGLVGISSRAKPVSLSVDPDNTKVILGWPTRLESGQDHIHLYIQEMDGSVRYNNDLQPAIPGLDQIKIVHTAIEGLYVFWTSGSLNERVLWGATIPTIPKSNDLVTIKPIQISQNSESVVWFKSLQVGSDGCVILWLDDDGHVHTQLGIEGSPSSILDNVDALDANLDESGTFHMVWATIMSENHVDIISASLNTSRMKVDDVHRLTSIRLPQRSGTDYVRDLSLSVLDNHHMISWTQPYDYGGRSARRLVTMTYVYDRVSQDQIDSQNVYPLTRDFPPEMFLDSQINMHIVKAYDNQVNETNVRGASSSTAIPDVGTVLAASVQYATRTRIEYQPTLVYLNEHGFIGHHPLTWTDHPSIYPVVTSDKSGHLYAAWVDNIGIGFQYPVYLTTTQADLRDISRHLRLVDYAVIGWDWLNRVVMGIVLVPFVVQWFLLPIAFLVVVLIRGEYFGRRGTYALLVGLFLFWAGKYLMTSQVLTLVPTTLAVPLISHNFLSRLVPVFTLLAGVFGEAAYHRLTHRREERLFSRFLRISLLDAAISISIYAIGSFG